MIKVRIKLPVPLAIAFGTIAIVIVYVVISFFAKKVTVGEVIKTEDQFYSMVTYNVTHYKSDIHFKTTLQPDTINYDQIFYNIVKNDTYIGSQIYAYNYRYTYSNGLYDVRLVIRDPAMHRVWLTKMRAKQMAKDLKKHNLTDYEMVKAVHDYLILTNEYSYSVSGAFNTFFVGHSACNGYAYSFYAIMEELGIEATCEFGGNHEWNRVKLDGEWYNIDLTWDDIGGKNVGYSYFLKSDADFTGHHHGGATAKESHEITGKDPIVNYALFPDYRLQLVFIVLLIAAAYIGFTLLMVKLSQSSGQKQKKAEKLVVYSVEDNSEIK